MNIDLSDLHYSPIIKHDYRHWFEEVQYNGKTLTKSERGDFLKVIDEAIEQYSEGLPLMYNWLSETKDMHDEYHELQNTVLSVHLFVTMTTIDSMVASKYFILADKDYDRRFMRGKLFVILNEGFKKLYGFDKKTYPKSVWDRLLTLMKYFPEEINLQYQELTYHLEKQSKASFWWKDERNFETHLETEKLYVSRQEEIIESKVMIDSMKLFTTLSAVCEFLSNMHNCLINHLVTKYRRGEVPY